MIESRGGKLPNRLVLALISEFGSSVGIPTNLHYREAALLRPLDHSVEGHYGSNMKERISLISISLGRTYESPNGKVRFQDQDAKGKMYVTELAE